MSDSSSVITPNNDTSRRSVIFGAILSSIVVGIQSLALCQYGTRFSRDRLFFKVIVILLAIFSFVAWCLSIYGAWTVSAPSEDGHLTALFKIQLPLSVMTLSSGFLSQIFFGRRVFNLGGINKWLIPPGLLIMTAPLALAIPANVNLDPNEKLGKMSWRVVLVELALWISATIDVILTGSLVKRLFVDLKKVQGFSRSTRSLISRITLIALTTGLISTVFTLTIAVVDLCQPQSDSAPWMLGFLHPQIYSSIVVLSLNLRGDNEGWKDHRDNYHGTKNGMKDIGEEDTFLGVIYPLELEPIGGVGGERREDDHDGRRKLVDPYVFSPDEMAGMATANAAGGGKTGYVPASSLMASIEEGFGEGPDIYPPTQSPSTNPFRTPSSTKRSLRRGRYSLDEAEEEDDDDDYLDEREEFLTEESRKEFDDDRSTKSGKSSRFRENFEMDSFGETPESMEGMRRKLPPEPMGPAGERMRGMGVSLHRMWSNASSQITNHSSSSRTTTTSKGSSLQPSIEERPDSADMWHSRLSERVA